MDTIFIIIMGILISLLMFLLGRYYEINRVIKLLDKIKEEKK